MHGGQNKDEHWIVCKIFRDKEWGDRDKCDVSSRWKIERWIDKGARKERENSANESKRRG
jgi:hypothetical protein